MPSESLAAALSRAGSPVELLRNLSFPPSTFPVKPEFTNWRTEQRAWLDSCALLDQSHHMTDLFVEGPDALRLFSDVAVNTFACLNCHSNRPLHVAGSENRYREPIFDGQTIGCERCHGPGELHVAAQSPGGSTISTMRSERLCNTADWERAA